MPLIGATLAVINGGSYFGLTRSTVVFLTHFVLSAIASCVGVDTFLPPSPSEM